MSIFTKAKKGGIADVIRCDEEDYLVWKWHPNAYNKGELKRENQIRTNSILRVKSGEVAVFVYKQNNGTLEDYIEGPFEDSIKTKNFPVLTSIIGLWYEKDTPFQAEVYFINVSKTLQIDFGVPYFNVVDPRFLDYDVPVAVRGKFTFEIKDYKAFSKYYRLKEITLDELKDKIRDSIVMDVKESVANAPTKYGIAVVNLESKVLEIQKIIFENLSEKFIEIFGIKINSIDIRNIEVDKESEGYLELKSVTKDISKRQVEANVLNYEEQLRIQREEGQYAQHMQTRQSNLGAYQTEIGGQVGVAGAEALGKMGENGAGNIDMGGHSGFNPMNMMAGIALGSAVGQNISSTLNRTLNSQNSSVTPPPVPTILYYIAKEGQPTGPYDIETLKNMIIKGEVNKDSLVWKEGMSNWQNASNQNDLLKFFPPDLPNEVKKDEK